MKEGGEEERKITNPRSTTEKNLHLLNEKGASRKGKSCKGCLYYSSSLKSNHRNPLCVGFTRSLPKGSSIPIIYL